MLMDEGASNVFGPEGANLDQRVRTGMIPAFQRELLGGTMDQKEYDRRLRELHQFDPRNEKGGSDWYQAVTQTDNDALAAIDANYTFLNMARNRKRAEWGLPPVEETSFEDYVKTLQETKQRTGSRRGQGAR